MADLAKLANLSKRVKATPPKEHPDVSPLSQPMNKGGGAEESSSATAVEEAPAPKQAAAPASAVSHAPAVSHGGGGGGGGGPVNVTVKVDLSPIQDVLGRVRDEIRNLRDELTKTREKGMKVELGDATTEQMDQLLKHFSALSKAQRELTEKMVTSLPESRWYGDLLNLGREVGENLASGGGGGGGGGSSAAAADIVTIKEALALQQTQLTAIMSMLQRR